MPVILHALFSIPNAGRSAPPSSRVSRSSEGKKEAKRTADCRTVTSQRLYGRLPRFTHHVRVLSNSALYLTEIQSRYGIKEGVWNFIQIIHL